MSDVFYRVSVRNPLDHPTSKSDLVMFSNGSKIVASLDYWKFSNHSTSDLDELTRLRKEDAVESAKTLFGIDFVWEQGRGLCYDGVAVCKNQRAAYEMINSDGTCYTTHEKINTDVGKTFWVWYLQGKEIAPLPEGDGYIIKPQVILDREPALEFSSSWQQFCGRDLAKMLHRDMVQCCADIDKKFGHIWKARSSAQYRLYKDEIELLNKENN